MGNNKNNKKNNKDKFSDKRSLYKKYCILGAGPAGLGAAWELSVNNNENDIIIIDKNNWVGGLSRTEKYQGNLFDTGPHRFFTKNSEVNKLWHKLGGSDFRPVKRLTRILSDNKLFQYPINAKDVFLKKGLLKSFHALMSYLYSQMNYPTEKAINFEEWVIANFGFQLYRDFFKTYTEKVWGIPCNEICSEWATQRIGGLDLKAIVKNTLGFDKKGKVKTLVNEFDYPAKGAGMIYERMAEKLSSRGVQILMQSKVISIETNGDRVVAVDIESPGEGTVHINFDFLISSIPITHFIGMVFPPLETSVRQAARELYYRDHISVNLIVNKGNLIPDQWIYVHSPEVRVARIANYKNFSNEMAENRNVTPLGIEYFTFRDDLLWNMKDNEIIEFAIDEVEKIMLIPKGSVQGGYIIRETETYPTYFLGYKAHLKAIRQGIDSFQNYIPIGRGGMYKYNNMDHALYTGLLAGRNLINNCNLHYNIWQVNIDAEYHESSFRNKI